KLGCAMQSGHGFRLTAAADVSKPAPWCGVTIRGKRHYYVEDDVMTWTGGCLCGAVRYQAEADPLRAVICHCVTCRRGSGAPMMCLVHLPGEAFRWLGSP